MIGEIRQNFTEASASVGLVLATALHRKIFDGSERSEGVLKMANNTKALPAMDVNISGTLRMQFTTTTVSELELLSIFSMLLDFDSFLLSKE